MSAVIVVAIMCGILAIICGISLVWPRVRWADDNQKPITITTAQFRDAYDRTLVFHTDPENVAEFLQFLGIRVEGE